MHGAVYLEMVKFCLNESNYLPHVIDEVEGKNKGPNTLVKRALLNKIRSITSGSAENLIDREAPDVHINPIAELFLQINLCWFSEQKSMRNSADAGFRSDPMCLLVLSCQLFMDIRGGVLEDVLGLEDVLEDTFSSPWPWPRRSSPWPWPWPRNLKSSKIALSSARGQHHFLNS